MKLTLCACLLLFLCFQAFPQQVGISGPGKIKGRVVDSVSGSAIAYATVTCFAINNNTVAGGMITDDGGLFVIDNLPVGRYLLKVDFLGYGQKIVEGIEISDKRIIVNSGDVRISSNTKLLKDVTVTGSKNFMEYHLDKLVYNVEKDLTSQGGVATDILKKVPQVSVDVDGNVELLGSQNIRVFINGKPSTMFDNNLAEALMAIPASQIKSIEVITSPGAQYDAQGTGGIINIILKDNKSQGINGSVAVTGGTRLNNGSANIHARKGKIDLSASLSGNAQLKGTTINTSDKLKTNSARNIDSSEIVQSGPGTLEKNGYRGQLGMEWNTNKKSTLSASVSYNNFRTTNHGTNNQAETVFYPIAVDNTVRYSNNTFRYKTADWNINYLKKMAKEGQELNLAVQGSNGSGRTWFDQYQDSAGSINPFAGGNGLNKLTDNETYVMADYAHPLDKDMVLNVGTKGSFSRISCYSENSALDTSSETYQLNQTNNFNFSRDVYAAYVSLTFPMWDVYSLKLGVRDEYTNNGIPTDTGNVAPSYNSFIPSIIVSRKLGKNQTIKASYYRRIQRAGYRQLNPFIDATDPTSLLQGNPYLKPERTNAAELTYSRFFEQGSSILINCFYRNTRDDEQTYILNYDSITIGHTIYKNATVTTNENAGNQQLAGINISGILAVNQKLEVRGNFQVFNKYIVSNLVPGTTFSSYNYRSNINASYKFSGTLVAEFFGNFNSARTEIQGKFPSFTSYSFAARKVLTKKKASIAVTTTNPFNQYTNQATAVTGTDFTVNSNRKIPYQSFGINFTYKFGKMEYKEKKKEEDETQNQ